MAEDQAAGMPPTAGNTILALGAGAGPEPAAAPGMGMGQGGISASDLTKALKLSSTYSCEIFIHGFCMVFN